MADSEPWGTRVGRASSAPLEVRQIRRSGRKAAVIPVWLRREEEGRTWEEETETLLLSRYGALVDCRRFVESGGALAVVRRDTGRRATARVAYGQYGASGRRELAIEFVGCDNFWEVDWDTVETVEPAAAAGSPAPSATLSSRAPRKPRRAARKHANLDETLLAAERLLWEALGSGDAATLGELVGDELVSVSARGRRPGAAGLEPPAGDYTLDDFRVTSLHKTAAVVSYLALDAEARLAYHSSLWLLRDGHWQLVFHQHSPAA
jgi:hypothetical protein